MSDIIKTTSKVLSLFFVCLSSTGIKPYKNTYFSDIRMSRWWPIFHYWKKLVFKERKNRTECTNVCTGLNVWAAHQWIFGFILAMPVDWKKTALEPQAVEWTSSVFCCHLSSRVSKSSNHAPVGSGSPWLHSSVKLIIVGPPLLRDLSLFLLSFCFLHTSNMCRQTNNSLYMIYVRTHLH